MQLLITPREEAKLPGVVNIEVIIDAAAQEIASHSITQRVVQCIIQQLLSEPRTRPNHASRRTQEAWNSPLMFIQPVNLFTQLATISVGR